MKLPFISDAMLSCKSVGDLHVARVVVFCLEVSWYLGRCPPAPRVSLQEYKPLTGFCQLLSGRLRTKLSLGFTSWDPIPPATPQAPGTTANLPPSLHGAWGAPPLRDLLLQGEVWLQHSPLCTEMCNDGQWCSPKKKNGVLTPFFWTASILSCFPGSAY